MPVLITDIILERLKKMAGEFTLVNGPPNWSGIFNWERPEHQPPRGWPSIKDAVAASWTPGDSERAHVILAKKYLESGVLSSIGIENLDDFEERVKANQEKDFVLYGHTFNADGTKRGNKARKKSRRKSRKSRKKTRRKTRRKPRKSRKKTRKKKSNKVGGSFFRRCLKKCKRKPDTEPNLEQPPLSRLPRPLTSGEAITCGNCHIRFQDLNRYRFGRPSDVGDGPPLCNACFRNYFPYGVQTEDKDLPRDYDPATSYITREHFDNFVNSIS